MLSEKVQQIQQYAEVIAALLYEQTDPEPVKTLEDIEIAVRDQVLEDVSPTIALFLSAQGQEKIKVDGDSSKAVSEN